jgi:hypothetical protein
VRTLLRQLDTTDKPIEERNKDGRGLDRLADALRARWPTRRASTARR